MIRPLAHPDLPSVVRLINDRYRNAYEFIPYTQESFVSDMRGYNAMVFVAEEGGRIIGTVCLERGAWGEEVSWLSSSGKNRGVEDLLVAEAERNVNGDNVKAILDSKSPEIAVWLERGYHAEEGWCHLVARLDRELPSEPHEGLKIRSLEKGEEEKLINMVNSAFGWERLNLQILDRWKESDPSLGPEWIHVAETGGRFVSAIVSKPDRDYNVHFNGKRGYLGPAATLPEYRGRGIASLVTVRVMNFLREKGMDSVALYTADNNAASLRLLFRLGFKVCRHWKTLCKNLRGTG